MSSIRTLSLLLFTAILLFSACKKEGCTDPRGVNYDKDARTNDGSCRILGCTDPGSDNYDPTATEDNGTCSIAGCMDELSANYNPNATVDDGSCELGYTVFHVSPGGPHTLPLSIYIAGKLKGEIQAAQSTATCDFSDDIGELTVKMPPGTYTLTVGSNQTLVGSVIFSNGKCGQYAVL